jgi:hypothetical protein
MKRFMPVFLFLFAVSANAQVRWGARAGVVDGEPMIGADVIMKIGSSSFYFNPGIEVSGFGITSNADVHYDIELTRDAALWFGAGVALLNSDDERDLDAGVNLIGGVGTRSGRYIFYTQLKRTTPTGGDSFGTLAVGIRF